MSKSKQIIFEGCPDVDRILSEKENARINESVKVKAVIKIPAQTLTADFSMCRGSAEVFLGDSESQAEFLYSSDFVDVQDFEVESFEVLEVGNE